MKSPKEMQMEGLEERIKVLSRRIEEKESPKTAFAMAAKMILQLDKERLEAHLDDFRKGRPAIDGQGGNSALFRAMGVTPAMYSITPMIGAPACFPEYMVAAQKLGFPADKICDKVVSEAGSRSNDSLPIVDAILSDSHGCDNDHHYYAEVQGELFGIPVFFVDIPLHEDDKPTLASISYVAAQLEEFIEWAEKKFPGVKYDEATHIEILEADAIGEKYYREIYQLLKHVPCPLSPMDVLGRMFGRIRPSRYPNTKKAHECLRLLRDELGDRVASGRGPYPEERLRLLWAGQSHDEQALDPCKLLMERKVALPLTVQGVTPKMIGLRGTSICDGAAEIDAYGVKLSPLQEEAAQMCTHAWGGPGKRWYNCIVEAARDIGAHGIIHFDLIGCTPVRGMGGVVAERAKKELGIPTLNIEGRYLDRDYMSQEQFEEILSLFIDKCFDWAGKPRQ